MVQWGLWRTEKAVSMSVLFLWDITEIMATITLIGCTDNDCNPWSPWKQAARKQGEEHIWNQLNSSSTHEPARQALLGRCFGTHGDIWTPRTFFLSPWKPSESQNFHPLPSSSSSSPVPPSSWSLAQRTAEKAPPVGILLSAGTGLSQREVWGGKQPVSIIPPL